MDIKIRSEELNNCNLLLDVYHNHVASIKQDKKIRKITRAAYAKEIANKHAALLKTTLGTPGRAAIVSNSDKKIIAQDDWEELKFMNPHRIVPCQEATLRALEAYRIPLRDVSAFTVINRAHETSNTIFMKEADAIEKGDNAVDMNFEAIKRDFQNGLRGYNYIGVLEFAIFDGEKYRDKSNPDNNGWLIAPHLQGLIWKSGGLTKEDTEYFKTKFSGGRWGAKGFKHDSVWDVTGSASYMHKLPLFTYLKTYRHTNKEIPQKVAFVMFQRLKNIAFEKLFISGGEGQNIRTVILHYLQDFYQEYRHVS